MDFTQSFLQGAQAGQQRAAQQRKQEQDEAEFDLKKRMLKHQMDDLEIRRKIEERKTQAGVRENAFKEAEFKSGKFDPPPTPQNTVLGVPPPDAVPMQIPEGGYGEPAEQLMVPTKTGADKNKFKDLYEKTRVERQAIADSPPSQDQVIDNQRQAQAASDAKEARVANMKLQLLTTGSMIESRKLAAEISAQNLEISRERLQLARETAAKSNDPVAAQYLAEQVLTRKLDYRQLDRFERASVTKQLSAMGMPLPRELTAPEKANQQKAESALISTETVQQILKESPQTLALALAPGILGNALPGVAALRFHMGEMTDVKARLRTGAAYTEFEGKFYGGQAPQAVDLLNPKVLQTKINHFIGLNLSETGRPVKLTSPDGKDTFIVSDGYDAQQRADMRRKINAGWSVGEYKFEFPKAAQTDSLGILQ